MNNIAVNKQAKFNSNYYLLLIAFFISESGSWLYKLALPLIVLEITGSPSSMVISYAIVFLPFLLVSIFGGVIADRFNRRTVLIVGDFISAGGYAIFCIFYFV